LLLHRGTQRSVVGVFEVGKSQFRSGYLCKIGLQQLIKKKVMFIWPKELEQAFEDEKKTLTTGPILAYPDFTKTFYIILETSKTAVAEWCHCIRMELKIP
jgi:hypothetical protein